MQRVRACRVRRQDLHEGTVQYARRERQAAESLLQSDRPGAGSRDDDDDAPHASLRMVQLLRMGKPDAWPPAVSTDDDDKWLQVRLTVHTVAALS